MDNMTLGEALAAADVSTTPVNDILMVDAEARTIIVPASEMLFGVRQDMDAERKHFKCQKIVGDNVDLSNCHIYISYVPSKQDGTYDINEDVGAYLCEDLDVDGDYVTFSWKLSGNVFVKAGYIAFAVYAKQADADGNLQTKWHTTFAIGKVLDTLPDGEQIVEKYADVIEQLLNKMENVEKVATHEAMQNYVEAYLAENPPSGMTDEEREQLQKNTEDISSLSEEMEQLKSGSNSSDAETKIIVFNLAQTVEEVFKNTVFKSANTQAFDWLTNLVGQLKPEGVVSVTYYLTNCTIDNNSLYVMTGNSYTATVIPDSNTEFQGITVLMGGADITDEAVSDKTISIENITGDIIITAVSKSNEIVPGYAALSYVYSDDTGDAYIDTEWTMTDLGEKMELGVQLPETFADTSNAVPFFGVNADSAFSSVYSAIEVSKHKNNNPGSIGLGWNSYQPDEFFTAGYQHDFIEKAYYISLADGNHQLFEDEDMNTLHTGQFVDNTITKSFGSDGTRIPPFPIWLFRSNYQDVAFASANKKKWRVPGVKIYCFKAWDKDGVLKVDMRPAKRESDNTIGFYDVVREKFFSNNCETGSLKGV